MSQEIIGTSLEDTLLSLDELAQSCHVSQQWIIERVQCGVLLNDDPDPNPAKWMFNSYSFIRARKIIALERDFDCNPELAGLVADLIEEIERLRADLQKSGLKP
ncbi:chaperone modulatory protein CbpM [Nitrosomonas cryotolerans]|uniref:Chaperone modulatory protein CbpM n=1 Tax=Nitrosomonas cryotolerans ATCC 49181 TaxID=1131553 RepID=A0A1N6FRL4_9PROT|nr:chaperone modulator CbpM [Nitrosomonas cryotolerans]SFP94154.1 chaperone modulatory protein CbpM [Nitrosomonas cryotolerans]SIN97890.1 chaperone modulatory protein CbpM [Nitrosomonas cryotolerans ATCC 49181]